jgi:fumarylacetoacetase
MITENDRHLRSWVESANDGTTDFPIQNLPFGVFSRAVAGDDADQRIGIAIGDMILDLKGCSEAGLLPALSPDVRCAIHAPVLNDLMALGREAAREVRSAASALLRHDNPRRRDDASLREELLIPMGDARMHLPAQVGDYTDFYASIHHAFNVGSMMRPDSPLMPNYMHLPVGYHGRASSIVVSGTPVRRPMGQLRPDDAKPPVFGPSRLLDYEMEIGCFVGPGNALGERIEMRDSVEHIFGLVIVNDWSARDIQKWEYQPLGPFNSKNFATSISPWVITLDALEPYRLQGPPRDNIGGEDPPTLDYLRASNEESKRMALDITCEVWLRPVSPSVQERGQGAGSSVADIHAPAPPPQPSPSERGRETLISRGNFRDMYWNFAQMLVHHTSTGCNLRAGDLIASGTVSGPAEESRGCLLERTWRGTKPVTLPDGSTRSFLQDGDEVIMRSYCEREGSARIGFGECRGLIVAAM